MIQVAIVTRRLKEGKTYEDFRKACYHTVGFGSSNKMYTMVNAFDPRELVVIDFTQRLAHSLDDVIEPEIGRKFGLLVAEDDFSATGDLAYQPPQVQGEPT